MERYASSVPWANTMTLRQKFVRPARHVQLASVRVVTEVALARAKLARLESFRRNLSATIVQQIPILVREAPVRVSADATLALQARMVDLANNAMQESTKRPRAVEHAFRAQNLRQRCLEISQSQTACVCLDMRQDSVSHALVAWQESTRWTRETWYVCAFFC